MDTAATDTAWAMVTPDTVTAVLWDIPATATDLLDTDTDTLPVPTATAATDTAAAMATPESVTGVLWATTATAATLPVATDTATLPVATDTLAIATATLPWAMAMAIKSLCHHPSIYFRLTLKYVCFS